MRSSARSRRIGRSWRWSCAAACRTIPSGRNPTSTSSLVTIDDKQLKPRDLSLYADGVNVHALPFTRTELREIVEGSRHSSFMHSFLAKGRLLYTHDETIAEPAGAAARARRARHADRAAPRRHRRRAGAVQGAQVDDHARRPRVHLAVDPLRGDGTGACRADCRAQDDRSRSAAAGAGRSTRHSSAPFTWTCSTCRRRPENVRPRSTPSTAT